MNDDFLPPELIRALRALHAQFKLEHGTGHYGAQWNYEGGELKVTKVVAPTYEFRHDNRLTQP